MFGVLSDCFASRVLKFPNQIFHHFFSSCSFLFSATEFYIFGKKAPTRDSPKNAMVRIHKW